MDKTLSPIIHLRMLINSMASGLHWVAMELPLTTDSYHNTLTTTSSNYNEASKLLNTESSD